MFKKHEAIPETFREYTDLTTYVLGDVERWCTEYLDTGIASSEWDTWRAIIDKINLEKIKSMERSSSLER